MPCGCFGGGAGVGKKDGDKYGPKGKINDESKVQLITTKPPVIEPIPVPAKAVVQTSAAPPTKGGSSPTDGTRREDDPDKANRRRDVVASYYSDECELLTYKQTNSRPTSQVGDGEGSPPAATSSPVPSSPASARSAASTRADLAEKRREFFKPLVEDTTEPPWIGNENSNSVPLYKQPLIGHDLAHPHAQSLLEKHDRQLENFKEPTVKDAINKFEHMPEQVSSSKLETEVILGKNSSTTVTVLHSQKEMRIANKPVNIISHQDEVKLTPEQEIQEHQLVNKASVHQQLLGGQAKLRPTPTPKPREFPDMPPPVTITVPDQPHNDDCIIQSATTPEVDYSTNIPAKPPREPSLSEARHIVAEPVVTEPETFERPRSFVEEPKSFVEEPKSFVEESKSSVEEPKSVVEEPKSVVEEPKSVVEETQYVAESQPFVADVKPIVEPEPIVAGHESENVIDLEHVQQSIESVEKTEPFIVSEQFSSSETEVTNTKLVKESLSDTFEITQTQDSKSIDGKDLTSANEPMIAAEDVSFVTQEADIISVLEENKKNILSSQSEQMPVENQPTNTTEILHCDQSYIIDSMSNNNENQEIFSQTENLMDDSPHVKFDHDAESEERISTISKEPMTVDMAFDMAKETLGDISDSKQSVEVKSTDDGTMHTQITKSMETDEDGNTVMHTRTIKTTSIGSSEPMSEMMEEFGDILSKPSMDINSSDDGTHTQTTKSTVTDEDGNTVTHTRTIKSTTISSSDPMSEILSTEAFMTEPLLDKNSAFISESSSMVKDGHSEPSFMENSSHPNGDQQQQPSMDIKLSDDGTMHTQTIKSTVTDEDGNTITQTRTIKSTTISSSEPMTQVGTSPTPSSTPSPRNSIHSSPSPPASPDSPRAQKMDKVELQHEQEPLASQLKQEVQESSLALTQDQLSQEDNATLNSVIKKDAKTNGPPSPSIDSRNPHTCNEADITAPTSQEDDGLGSEIDDALDSIDCLSEEANSHSLQHHHQSVPAPPPPSSAS